MRVAFLTILISIVPAVASAQDNDTRERARALVAEAQAHEDGQRWALAAQTYQQLYQLMSQAGLPRASVALWTAGSNLARVPGREREASDALQRFLAESAALASDPEIAGYRAEAPRLIAELEARVGPGAPRGDLPAPALHTETRMSPVGPVVLGVGAAAVVVGIIVGAFGVFQDDDLTGMCPTRLDCSPDLATRYSQAQTLAGVGDGLWIGGAVVAAVGLVLTLVLTEDDSEVSAGTTLAVGCGPSGCFARGRF
ncbi:MAG: hypothetical protein AB7S26_13055 [Sandaracinaceae bacterium]